MGKYLPPTVVGLSQNVGHFATFCSTQHLESQSEEVTQPWNRIQEKVKNTSDTVVDGSRLCEVIQERMALQEVCSSIKVCLKAKEGGREGGKKEPEGLTIACQNTGLQVHFGR